MSRGSPWPGVVSHGQIIYAKNSAQENFIFEQVDILISKNQALQILYLKHHDSAYKTV